MENVALPGRAGERGQRGPIGAKGEDYVSNPQNDAILRRILQLITQDVNIDQRNLELLVQQQQKLEGMGSGALNIAPCIPPKLEPGEEAVPTEVTYEGDGLSGIYSAIAAIAQSLNLIHTDTKCPPTGNGAALPMHFETKAGTVPQLVISWRPAEGGQSKWSFCIPHPKPSINHNTIFNFPRYTKGNIQFTYTLTNNSKVVLNTVLESEGYKILNYVKTLIDPNFIRAQATPKITKGAGQGNLREVLVKATYVQKFQGHLSEIAIWAKSL